MGSLICGQAALHRSSFFLNEYKQGVGIGPNDLLQHLVLFVNSGLSVTAKQKLMRELATLTGM